MSVLSEWDIIKELGKDILIYPFKGKDTSFRGCYLCLTASEYVYSLKKGDLLLDPEDTSIPRNKKCFEISQGDTVIVWTNESVSITNSFCGSIYSRVSLVSKGVGHIGTRLNPNWGGVLAIALHNVSNQSIQIKLDEVIAYLAFHRLTSESSTSRTLDDPGRVDVIPAGSAQKKVQEWIKDQNNKWRRGDEEVLRKLLDKSEDYKEAKKKLKERSTLYRNTLGHLSTWNRSDLLSAIAIVVSILSLFVGNIEKWLPKNILSPSEKSVPTVTPPKQPPRTGTSGSPK